MARSLTVKHEEKASTTPLFTFFLLLAFGWMAMTAFFSGPAEAVSEVPVAQ